ncbi:MAG: glutamate-1-semialdehyde 2,1-aminomutase [Proteobacteria bacterium]|nr:glutamate-1-semialdehyde 2,1-aminomutase [Pseudomonadota bacterium]
MLTRSKKLFKKAQKIIPGGVNSPVRAFKAVGGNPLFIRRGKGSRIEDVDGNIYVDYVCSWGPLILGHAHPAVVNAIQHAAKNGSSFGAPTEMELEMAEIIISAFPSIDMVRLVNSGTEACMSAIRMARAFTNRSKIVKFSGCYHGHADGLLVAAGSGAATLTIPASSGIPESCLGETVVLPFNDLQACKNLFSERGEEIAAVIVEPIPGNMGVVYPQDGFLKGLRRITRNYGSLLIFDEVISGFRVAWGGAQTLFNIAPDITCLGKIIGGGLPIGAYGGRREIMEQVAPLGGMYQAGTLSGNPVAVAAGIATLKTLKGSHGYGRLDRMGKLLCEGIRSTADRSTIPVRVEQCGSLFTIFFCETPPSCYEEVKNCDFEAFKRFFNGMLKEGVYLPPSPFETAFISLAHTKNDITMTIEAAGRVFAKMHN